MRKILALFWFVLSLSSASAQDISPNLTLSGSTPIVGCTSLQVLYNNADTLGCMAGTSWDNTNRSLTITGAAVTASNPILNVSQIWDNVATQFEAVVVNVTNTNSASASKLLTTKIGGTSVFSIDKAGIVRQSSRTEMQSDSATLVVGASGDVRLSRRAAANWRFGDADANPPIAQTLSVQGSSGTNIAAAAGFTVVGPLATGNAAPGDIILQTGAVGASGATASTATTALTIKGTTQDVTFAKSATFAEMTAPSAPAANGARLYCDDNGAGKTRCSILFASGAAQQIAIEP